MWSDPTNQLKTALPPDKSWTQRIWTLYAWDIAPTLRLVAVTEQNPEREFPVRGWRLEEVNEYGGWSGWHIDQGAWEALLKLRG